MCGILLGIIPLLPPLPPPPPPSPLLSGGGSGEWSCGHSVQRQHHRLQGPLLLLQDVRALLLAVCGAPAHPAAAEAGGQGLRGGPITHVRPLQAGREPGQPAGAGADILQHYRHLTAQRAHAAAHRLPRALLGKCVLTPQRKCFCMCLTVESKPGNANCVLEEDENKQTPSSLVVLYQLSH